MLDLNYGVPNKNLLNPFIGIELYADKNMPEFEQKIILKLDLPISNGVRNKINKNLLDMFGVERVFFEIKNRIMAHPNNIEILQEKFSNV